MIDGRRNCVFDFGSLNLWSIGSIGGEGSQFRRLHIYYLFIYIFLFAMTQMN